MIHKHQGQGYPLVFFHGWGFDHRVWLPIVHQLEEKYSLYLIDLPGFGSAPMMDWGQFKRTLLAGLPLQFAVAGWSMGGLYATRLALEEQNRVSHLLNIASSPYFIKSDNWPGIELQVLNTFMTRLQNNPQQTRDDFIKLQARGHTVQSDNASYSTESLQQGLNVLLEWDLRDALMHYEKPTSYLFGRLDAITPYATMKAMQQIFPSFDYFIFAKAAHMPFLSHQHEFLTYLEQFLP